jgi:benzoyl-CoA reductase/2-hydroxyglutaryl-CoA dehydratase subunit BcrC/BadD/HgdB
MIESYFRETAAGIEERLAEAESGDLVARKTLTLQTARLGMRLFSGKEPVAWCGVLAPFDLLHAMGITSCFVEFVGATLAGTGEAGRFVDLAESAGFSSDGCTYHRTVTGATLAGLMPEPQVLVATSCPCAGGMAVIENMAAHFQRPLFVLDVPYRDGEKEVGYLTEQLQALVDFLAAHTGRSLDQERLRDAVEKTNEARAWLLEMYELAREVPTPARRRDLINLAFVIALSFGTQEGVDIARVYRDEFARKVEMGMPGVPGEKLRLLWFQNRIQFRSGIEEMLENDYQAAVVVDELNDIPWGPIDPEDPLSGIARRMISNPLAGDIRRRIDGLQALARSYRVDGVINPCHWGCRQGTGSRGLIAAGMREIGLPMLSLEVDCVDERNFAEGQVRTRVQAFMEMLQEAR